MGFFVIFIPMMLIKKNLSSIKRDFQEPTISCGMSSIQHGHVSKMLYPLRTFDLCILVPEETIKKKNIKQLLQNNLQCLRTNIIQHNYEA